MAGETENQCGTDGGPVVEPEVDECPQPESETPSVKQGWSGTLSGGVVVENGLICHVPDCWPLSIFPKNKAPCSNCSGDCSGCEGGCNNYDEGPGISIEGDVISIDLTTLTDAQKAQLCALVGECTPSTCTDGPVVPDNETITVEAGSTGSQELDGECSDPCGGSPTVTHSALPAGFSYDDGTNQLSWDGTAPVGTSQVTFTCDNENSVDTWVITLIVDDVNVNDPPVINPPADLKVVEGQAFDQTFSAVCVDNENDGVVVTASGLPAGLSSSQTVGGGIRINGTPAVGSAGSSPYVITINCTDTINLPVTQTFEIEICLSTIDAPDDCPFEVEGNEGAALSAGPFGTFVSSIGAPVSLTFSGLPAGVIGTDLGNGTWVLSGNFPSNSSSPYSYDVEATSGSVSVTCAGNTIVSNAVAALVVDCLPLQTIEHDLIGGGGSYGPFGSVSGGVGPYTLTQSGVTIVGVTFVDLGNGTWQWNISPTATVDGPQTYVVTVEDDAGNEVTCTGGSLEVIDTTA